MPIHFWYLLWVFILHPAQNGINSIWYLYSIYMLLSWHFICIHSDEFSTHSDRHSGGIHMVDFWLLIVAFLFYFRYVCMHLCVCVCVWWNFGHCNRLIIAIIISIILIDILHFDFVFSRNEGAFHLALRFNGLRNFIYVHYTHTH